MKNSGRPNQRQVVFTFGSDWEADHWKRRLEAAALKDASSVGSWVRSVVKGAILMSESGGKLPVIEVRIADLEERMNRLESAAPYFRSE